MLVAEIKSGRKYIGKVLVEQGLIDQHQLDECLAAAKLAGKKIGNVLKERGLVDDAGLAQALSKQLGIPFVDLGSVAVPDEVLRVIPESLAETHMVLPLEINNGVLTLAMGNPLDSFALEDVRFVTQLPVKIVVAPEGQVLEALPTMRRVSIETGSSQAGFTLLELLVVVAYWVFWSVSPCRLTWTI